MWFIRHIHAIARSSAAGRVSLLTRPRSQAHILCQGDPFIEEILWLHLKKGQHDGAGGLRCLAKELRPHKFQEAWILHSRSLRYPLACRLAGIPMVYGPGFQFQRFLLSRRAQTLSGSQREAHPILRATHLVENHGLPFQKDLSVPALKVPEPLKTLLTQEFSACPRPWMGLGISSSEKEKKWPASSFIQLGKDLLTMTQGSIFILGGQNEQEEGLFIESSLREISGHVHFVSRELWTAFALISLCDFIVGNDTGILHAAPMVGGRGLVLLGSAQVPIHHYAPLQGLCAPRQPFQTPLSQNNLSLLGHDHVFSYLQSLGWLP